MTMAASCAADRLGDLEGRLDPRSIRQALFAASSKEVRHGATTKRCVFAPQFRFERAIAAQKENLAPQLGALSLRTLQRVTRDQQVVGLFVAKHFHSDECCFDNNSVNPVR